jgi:hypothetical protein
MKRRTILLGLAGILVSLPLSLGTHPFLSDPEEVAQQLTEWSLEGDLEKLVELYDPEDVVTFQQVVLATGDLYARHGELPPLAEAGLDPAQARALDPPQFMRKALGGMYEKIRRARQEYTIDMTAEVLEQSAAAAMVTVVTQVRLTPAQVGELGSLASLVQMPNERVYRMRRERGRWYVRFDENMYAMVAQARAHIDAFESRARRDRPLRDDEADPERFKKGGYRDQNGHSVKLYGYRDTAGRTVIEPRFTSACDFHEGLAAVRFFYRWGFIDRAGRTVVAPHYQRAENFSEGLAGVQTIHELWGFVDRTGRLAIPARYDRVRAFHEGLAAVRHEDVWGFINPSGAVVILFEFADADDFSDGHAQVSLRQDHRSVFIDRTGRILPEEEVDEDEQE